MGYLRLITVSAVILGFGLSLGAVLQPAEAGQACDAAGLSSPCAGSSDIKPNIKLGKSGDDGDFIVKRKNGNTGVKLDGQSGNVTNRLLGNGVVKAWARIRDDGTILSCWRCNTNTSRTQRTAPGRYTVDFTPLGTNISDRPRAVTVDFHDGSGSFSKTLATSRASSDLSSVRVFIFDTLLTADSDESFTIMIY